MATKKVTKKTAAKTADAKKAPAKKSASRKAAAGKAAPAKDAVFHIFDETAKAFIPADKATEIRIKGFEKFRFFSHKATDGKSWAVSEAASGARIIFGKTREEAQAKAKALLDKHGADRLAECVRGNIAKHGVAPGMQAPERSKEMFTVTTDDGESVEVMYNRNFQHHLEFKGKVSPTGYRSHFGYDGSGDVREEARKLANTFRAELLKKQVKVSGNSGKGKPTPQVTTRLKSKILAALVDGKGQDEELCQ